MASPKSVIISIFYLWTQKRSSDKTSCDDRQNW